MNETATTLTERYVDATLSWVPSAKRADIERELRASIADAIDSRVEAGADRKEAEVAVLTDLGDPARLAAGYAERPLYLIGPALFLDYIRLLRTLLAIIVPIVAAVVAFAQAVRGEPALQLAGEVLSAVISTALQVAFWTTLVFAVLERLPGDKKSLTGPWTPERLPELRRRRPQLSELIAEAVWAVVVVTALLLAPSLSPERDPEGGIVIILHPWLWDSGVVYVIIGLVLIALAVPIMSYYYGRWTTARATVAALLEMAMPILLIWLATNDRIINPAFAEAMRWPQSLTDLIHGVIIAVSAVAIGGAIVKAVNRVRR